MKDLIEIHSQRAELGEDSDGRKLSGFGNCADCENYFEENEPIIIISDYEICISCTEQIRNNLTAEINKYK